MQQENNFQDLQIFEDPVMNIYCDNLTNQVFTITDKKPHLVGSVARIFSGSELEDYMPKDVDFAIDNSSFRKILAYSNHRDIFPFAKMVEKRPERFIIYTESKVIELWNFFYKNYSEELKLYKDKIPYLCQ
ncbi:hypothetical protein [Chryseobacterium sp.]|uniref:hypothetical protein n=1 Tax=Chryseobacterium sp. TaxID=1871047 RepID=UPI00289BE3E2|nr:hypothetical protein [Chryseobacterium sp.]